jgi:hypothetical protein|tara:strand:+ start:5666 stop:6070 length:405 start_codon:yes stop_codon:yes gene_type:complete
MNLKENITKQLRLLEETDDRPDNWRELPGYNPEGFYDDAFRTMRDKIDSNEFELDSMEDDIESVHDEDQNETLNTILDRLDYVEELNADMLDFLHNLVDTLKDEDKYKDMAREFTVLLNRGGRRKFYQQSTNRL